MRTQGTLAVTWHREGQRAFSMRSLIQQLFSSSEVMLMAGGKSEVNEKLQQRDTCY